MGIVKHRLICTRACTMRVCELLLAFNFPPSSIYTIYNNHIDKQTSPYRAFICVFLFVHEHFINQCMKTRLWG